MHRVTHKQNTQIEQIDPMEKEAEIGGRERLKHRERERAMGTVGAAAAEVIRLVCNSYCRPNVWLPFVFGRLFVFLFRSRKCIEQCAGCR